MSTKFFNNNTGNTLFERLSKIAGPGGMGEKFQVFKAVAGYFRSSGWFKLREQLGGVRKIQILVGIDIDDIMRKRERTELFFTADNDETRRRYSEAFSTDVREAGYTQEIEHGILQLCQDVVDGRVELRIHNSRNLHAKFYLCLPEDYGEHSEGRVIMGSSNLTDAGLGTRPDPNHRYELNVEIRDFDDVDFCRQEFERLWEEGVPVTADDIVSARKATHLGQDTTPFELFMRVLIDLFGEQAEDDFSMELPDGFLDLKYQRDAVVQGYGFLKKHNGFFLADVVGLGKTVIAAMIARRFREENGARTRILVVYPPAVRANWRDTFKRFGLASCTQFLSNGSLDKVLEERDNYLPKEDFDLVIVDESHNFRNSNTAAFDKLQRICKAPRGDIGRVDGMRKKVILVSATALNNTPADLLNQILLFQDARRSTLDGIVGIRDWFAPRIARYKKIMREAKQLPGSGYAAKIDALYAEIQKEVMEKITVRRTRQNILNEPDYRADLEKQGVVFPEIEPPRELTYRMDEDLDALFWETFDTLKNSLRYARYRAIEFLLPPASDKYPDAVHVATILAGVYKTHMVKRLESSFHAFKQSVDNFIATTDDMIRMFSEDKVLIIPELDVGDLLDRGLELDQIVERAISRGYAESVGDVCYPASAFRPELLELLKQDRAILTEMKERWAAIDYDPKFDLFVQNLRTAFFTRPFNPTGKLVLFSESVDTLEYLESRLRETLGRDDILLVHSGNRDRLQETIRVNFDANYVTRKDDVNILLTSDVLSEGINLHRANVIVNYDSPWNSTRLMQRIGRVNRIGSEAPAIHNVLFYPSKQGNAAIGLYQNSVIKLQGFHSALGEDSQIYSHEEMLRVFHMFNTAEKDDVDEMLRFLRLAREFRKGHPAEWERLKALPPKSRAGRAGADDATLVYLSTPLRKAFFLAHGSEAVQIPSAEALKLLEAVPEEKPLPLEGGVLACNYAGVRASLTAFGTAGGMAVPAAVSAVQTRNKAVLTALGFLRVCLRWEADGALSFRRPGICAGLQESVSAGRYQNLEKELAKLAKGFKGAAILAPDRAKALAESLEDLFEVYADESSGRRPVPGGAPTIIVSETFVPQQN